MIEITEHPEQEGGRHSATVTWTTQDDPNLLLHGAITKGRLTALLTVYASSLALLDVSGEDALTTTGRAAMAMERLEEAMAEVMLIDRDHHGLGWGTIAGAVEAPKQSTKRRILTSRREHAEDGYWFDPAGVHGPDPAAAAAHVARCEAGGDTT